MNAQNLLDQLVELLKQLDIDIRITNLGGSGGSLVTLRGRKVLFVDSLADPEEQLLRLAPQVARLDGLDELFMVPELRELLEGYK